MEVRQAVLTAAGRGQRTLPLQKVVDRDGVPKSVLRVLCDASHTAGVERVAVVVRPGDETSYAEAAEDAPVDLTFVPQAEPQGYAHALACAREFVGNEAFLHFVGDHIFVPDDPSTGIAQVVETARNESTPVSAVLPTRENALPQFGAVGAQRVPQRERLWEVRRVLEKPTPTVAEQELHVPGLRVGQYLCFAGIHVFTPELMNMIVARVEAGDGAGPLSDILDAAASRLRYLAFELSGQRFDLGQRYGLFGAQLALGLAGVDREIVLERVLDVFALRDAARGARS